MATSLRVPFAAALVVVTLSGCTLAKPIVGAVMGPAVVLGGVGGSGVGCCCNGDDGRAILGLLAIGSAIGVVTGLVTGIISDVQALTGAAPDPTRNWWNPLATNTTPDS
jgi:hypothetical protein